MTEIADKRNIDGMLNDLMLENHITIKDVCNCAEEHKPKFKNMMNIFDLENERDQRLSLMLLHLLSRERGEEVTAYYCREHQLSVNIGNRIENFPWNDVNLLLTACLYNPAFFFFALDLCEKIQIYLGQRERRVKPHENRIPGVAAAVAFTVTRAAATLKDEDADYHSFNNDPIKTPPEIQPGGTLDIQYKERENGFYDLLFIFSFNDPCEEPPYLPEIECIFPGKSEKLLFTMEEFHRNNSVLVHYLTQVERPNECKFKLIINQE